MVSEEVWRWLTESSCTEGFGMQLKLWDWGDWLGAAGSSP